MIVKDLEAARKILPSLNIAVDNDRLDDFLARAQQWVSQRIIGKDIEELLDAEVQGQDPYAELRVLVQRVIAEQAYLTASSELDVQLSEAGFVVQSNDYMKPAFDGRVDRLCQSLRERVKTDADNLVGYLFKNPDSLSEIADWKTTMQFMYLSQAFCLYTYEVEGFAGEQFDMYNVFLMMQPKIGEALRINVARYVSLAEVERLIELFRDGELLSDHKIAIARLKHSAVAYARGNKMMGDYWASNARFFMIKNISFFPAFAASEEFNEPGDTIDHGQIANFL